MSAPAQPTEICVPVFDRWTEIEYIDLMSGRYGVDREPVFTGQCEKPSTRTRGR